MGQKNHRFEDLLDTRTVKKHMIYALAPSRSAHHRHEQLRGQKRTERSYALPGSLAGDTHHRAEIRSQPAVITALLGQRRRRFTSPRGSRPSDLRRRVEDRDHGRDVFRSVQSRQICCAGWSGPRPEDGELSLRRRRCCAWIGARLLEPARCGERLVLLREDHEEPGRPDLHEELGVTAPDADHRLRDPPTGWRRAGFQTPPWKTR